MWTTSWRHKRSRLTCVGGGRCGCGEPGAVFSRLVACVLVERVLETCLSAAPPPLPPLESDEGKKFRPEDAERENRGRGLAVLPGLSFLSFLPGAVGKSGPSLLRHPLVCSPLHQSPSPLPFPPNWSQGQGSVAKSATGSGLLQKGFQHRLFDQSQSLGEKKKKRTWGPSSWNRDCKHFTFQKKNYQPLRELPPK